MAQTGLTGMLFLPLPSPFLSPLSFLSSTPSFSFSFLSSSSFSSRPLSSPGVGDEIDTREGERKKQRLCDACVCESLARPCVFRSSLLRRVARPPGLDSLSLSRSGGEEEEEAAVTALDILLRVKVKEKER